jgi:hypothetical protein
MTDRMGVCPRCLSQAREKRAVEERRVAALYGSVSLEEFIEQHRMLPEVRHDLYRSFREVYEFSGVADGVIKASYSGFCDRCGLDVDLEASKQFWPELRGEG